MDLFSQPPPDPQPSRPPTSVASDAPPWDVPAPDDAAVPAAELSSAPAHAPTVVAAPSPDAQTLYLLDAMALAYRSHFIFVHRPLVNSKGEVTSAAFGFTNALLKLIDDRKIDHLAVVFDVMGEGGTFRNELYADYKGHRPPPPDDLQKNIPWIEEIVEAFDLPVIKRDGLEADDLIGALAKRAEADGHRAVIVSPDKDFRQLLSGAVSIFRPAHRGEEFDVMTDDGFREAYGLEPVQFIDVLALMGDASDNVPGVPGIGEKTAIALVQQYGSVEALLDDVPNVKGKKAREGLEQHADDARLSKQLVTIDTNVDVDLDWERLAVGTHDPARLHAIFDRLEFRRLAGRFAQAEGGRADLEGHRTGPSRFTPRQASLLPDDAPELAFDFGLNAEGGSLDGIAAYDADAVDYRTVRTRADLDALADDLAVHAAWAMDTETTGLDAMTAGLVGLSFAWAEGQGVYVPVPLPDGTDEAAILNALRPAYEGSALKIGQNLKYDLTILAQAGVAVAGPLFDTLVAHYLIDPEGTHNLDALARKYLSYRTIPIEDLIGKKGKNQISMRDVPLDRIAPYASEDADITLRLYHVLQAELAKEPGLHRIAETIEFPLVPVLVGMERTGITVDTAVLADISIALQAEIERLEGEIYAAAGESFTIGSPQQLGKILFETIGLKTKAKTATGKFSTAENVLAELATEHPLPGLVIDWRKVTKLKSTYVDALPAQVNPETGRVHTSYSQTVAATGRLSSNNPNLQNIPIRTDVGREIRKAFVPRAGWTMLSADYVQIELRILADLAHDEALIAAFRDDRDVHTEVAARVFGIPPEEVTKDQRRKAKEVNYGIPYGVSAFGLAQRLRSSRAEAADLIGTYQKAYPKVMQWLSETVETARAHGFVETILGRRRYVPAIRASNPNERNAAERIAVNMPIQGTQADMIKLAMIAIDRRLRDEGFAAKMLLQVHDELVFEAPPEEIDRLRALVVEEMSKALPLPGGTPVDVDAGVGSNWLDAH